MHDLMTIAWSGWGKPECGVAVVKMAPQPPVDAHDHLFHEAALVTRGHATHVTAAGRKQVSKGDLILLRPQAWHGYEATRRRFSVINCLLAPSLLHQLLPVIGGSQAILELFWSRVPRPRETPPLVIRLSDSEECAVRDCLARISSEVRKPQTDFPSGATGMAIEWMARIAHIWSQRQNASIVRRLPARADDAVRRVSHTLSHRLSDRPTLQELGKSVGLAPSYLCRCFAARMGIGIIDYAHRLRAEEACRLLRLTSLPVTQIAQRLGYDEVAYFSRRFRSAVGVSPREYRINANFRKA